MPTSGSGPGRAESPLADAEFLVRTDHRVTVLEALAADPKGRRDLQELAGVSRTTVGRTLRAMEHRGWVEREGDRFDATPLGEFVAATVAGLLEDLETARKLRDVWELLPTDEAGFDVEACAAGVLTIAGTDDPYAPVNRFVNLLEGSERMRFVGFDVGLLEPARDALRRHIVDGMRADVVDPPEHAEHVLDSHPEFCRAVFATGNITVQVHDDPPSYGLCVLDSRVAVCGYHPEDGTARVLLDTDEPSIREWAEETFQRYRRQARPLSGAPTS